ncbi:hypothetical protein ACD591_12370 [Rufibacter glacialis]|uniref:Uncharacterized protein n=1 Tax=Rufibacter glacialis TaxID=1259555 RepID=A0A5M8QPM3_9BACT|nr:hypothetical protein [Rufibacter glacialis]KAA6437238.1 hypothetical protein FOE74_01700 [Rufibacter glacialis]GGK60866.1 hypothetical protein GCM10011405_06310 [Rufibacter glacialis]
MHKTFSLLKVVRTWALLFSVPLYMVTAALWLKEEIKNVVGEKEKNVVAAMKKQMQKALVDQGKKRNTVLLP